MVAQAIYSIFKNPTNINLDTLNIPTGNCSVISNTISYSSFWTAIDQVNNNFIVKGQISSSSSNSNLYTINISTGNITNSVNVTGGNDGIQIMEYNPCDSTLYALYKNPYGVSFGKLNYTTGIFTQMSGTICFNSVWGTLDPIHKQFIFKGQVAPNSATSSLYTIDISNGNILYSVSVVGVNDGIQIMEYNPCDTSLYCIYKNSSGSTFGRLNNVTGAYLPLSPIICFSSFWGTLCSQTNQFIFKGQVTPSSANSNLYTIDIITGNITNSVNVTAGNDGIRQMETKNSCCCNSGISINLGTDQTICENDTFILNPNSSNTHLIWQDNTITPSYTVTQQGTYWVNYSMGNCYTSDTVNIYYNPLPVINLGNDTILCQGTNIILNTNNVNSNFNWQDNSSSSSYTITQQGSYWVDVTTDGCSASDSITINYTPLPLINIGNDTVLCEGASLLLNAYYTNASYSWQNNSTNATFTVTQQGNYQVDVTVNDCSSSDSITINYNPSPVINFGNHLSICNGEFIILNATNTNATYLWQDNSTAPTYTVTQQGVYWVNVTENNCRSFDSVSVELMTCDVIIEIPNVFTPNNDNVNDYFIPKKITGINNINLSIFNRWGELLFQTKDMIKGWDGKVSNQASSDGTYFWILDYTTIKNEHKSMNGFLTLTR